ncbi:uncharacterized protein LOC132700708 [Cylas formicarius]|uniref:uncharacterized protein LOC132700708 n=1 Tax=Cylas formicarius TaxID=197179 RepID=UPI002958557E|nr:uncharacterized protein LOC132700708 [Cylas formicarius]
MLTYFQKLSSSLKPSSLWSLYSMLRSTINLKNNINISEYLRLRTFLKGQSDGYRPKKSKLLTPQQIKEFLVTAPDEKYLFTKVGLIFGIMGGCRREELMKIQITHIQDLHGALLVTIPESKTKTERQFVITGNSYNTCKKYIALRPQNMQNMTRFFLNYRLGKCTKQPIGINKFGNLAKEVAKFLKLPDAMNYSGHYLRKTSASILFDSGANVGTLKRNRGWHSTSVGEAYTDDSLNKVDTEKKILHSVENIGTTLECHDTQDISAGTSTFNSNYTATQTLFELEPKAGTSNCDLLLFPKIEPTDFLDEEETDMSTLLVPKVEMNYLDFEGGQFVQDPIELPEPIKNSQQTPNKGRVSKPKYVRDIKISDLSTPESAKRCFLMAKAKINRQCSKIKMLRQANRRLLREIKTMKDLVNRLRKKI